MQLYNPRRNEGWEPADLRGFLKDMGPGVSCQGPVGFPKGRKEGAPPSTPGKHSGRDVARESPDSRVSWGPKSGSPTAQLMLQGRSSAVSPLVLLGYTYTCSGVRFERCSDPV